MTIDPIKKKTYWQYFHIEVKMHTRPSYTEYVTGYQLIDSLQALIQQAEYSVSTVAIPRTSD